MSIFEQSKIRGYKFLDRCLTLPNYIITFYIEDMDSAKTMRNEVLKYYNSMSYDNDIESIIEKEQITIKFFNGSVINFITKENMISEFCSQVIFIDSRIRETYIQEFIKSKIDQYVFGDGNAILNPKPIYLNLVVEKRGTLSDNSVDEIQTMINAVAEAYPELKSNENYKELMSELTTTENLIANYRSSFNKFVKSYNQYVRQFPNKNILDMLGYEVVEYSYLNYDVSDDAPTNLFGD